jgi:hypothetical protein
MLRPRMTVLPDSALLGAPAAPGQQQATHELRRDQPYFLRPPEQVDAGAEPDGQLLRGSRVCLLGPGDGRLCQVRDAEGRAVATALAGLRSLQHPP